MTKLWVAALLLATTVSGCADFSMRRELGVVAEGPDPFTVVRNKSLEMPGDVSELPTPEPGAPSLVAPTPTADARTALLGAEAGAAAAPSASERALLQASGAAGASDEVRTLLKEPPKDDERLLDGLWGDNETPGEPLDASEEARRLAEEAQKSKNPDLIVPPVEE